MKIVVVGGGTAGWLAALMISKTFKFQHTVEVIESSKIGIIGAGEGSTGKLTEIIQGTNFDYGCNQQDFVKNCAVTTKLGINFVGWRPDTRYNYIAPIDGTSTATQHVDKMFVYALSELGEDRHIATELGYRIENQLTDIHINNGNLAYHFDAHKVGKYFKKVCGSLVKHTDAEVNEVIVNEKGNISSLTLSNGETVVGDFFIDATGFNRKLMSAINANKWISYKENLPVNSAMPFLVPYKEDERIMPVTTARAQPNGWMWDIPTLERRGCGYVFCDEFVTPEKAQEELEKNLGFEIDPIRVLKFDTGRLENLWVNNCLAIGLSAAFAEPLEATSIHTTVVQLQSFVDCIGFNLADTATEEKIKNYNKEITRMYDLLKDFLVMHYCGGRNDSEFWKYISSGATQTEFVKDIIAIGKHRIPNAGLFFNTEGSAGWTLWSYIMAGTGHITADIAKKEMHYQGFYEEAKKEHEAELNRFIKSKKSLFDNTDLIKGMAA